MNICILTSGHPPFDERIFWKFALSLNENGFNTAIICSTMDISREEKGIILKGFQSENISKREKITKLKELLCEYNPSQIICCEPVTIIAASEYRNEQRKECRIISDVTEWYPENVAHKKKGFARYLTFILLYFFNIYASSKADVIIIGERAKAKRYKFIAPFKKQVIIGYYPVLKYFGYSLTPVENELVLCYAGLISFERGIKTLLKTAVKIAEKYPIIKIKVKFIGKFQSSVEERELKKYTETLKNVKVEYAGWTTYDRISGLLKDVHICFDLRIKNFIYKNSLPIKIFEYMAAGKPFIYTDINPIREELHYDYCGQLVNPYDINEITEAVEKYIKDRELLTIHSVNGRRIIEQEKNWEKESLKLISLVKSFKPQK
jgi:glycosyltransferase involved in cell wall biosynthesis